MIVQVRTARPQIIMNGQDFYDQLAPYFLNLCYDDHCDGIRADDMHIQLADRDKRFINDWMPEKGAYMDVKIMCERWFSPTGGTLVLDCGRFWIDSVEYEMPQHTVSIKANSIPTKPHIKTMKETRGWENTSLKELAGQIASENDMTLQYESDVNPNYKRTEQTEQGALRFLKERASDVGLSIKCHRSAIVIFEEKKLEAAEPKFTLVYGDLPGSIYRMTGGHFITKIADTLKKAKLQHVDPETGELTTEEFTAPDDQLQDENGDNVADSPEASEESDSGEGGGDLPEDDGLVSDWNATSGSSAGQQKVKAHVRRANKKKDTCHLELSIGNPLVAAGQTFNLQGLGQFDGKWFIEAAHHKLAPKYTTELTVRRCLVGY